LQNGNESAAFRCLDIPTVHCMEHPYLTIQPNELKYSHYDIQDAYFLGEQCWKITMSVPENLDDLRQNFVFGYSSYNEDEHALTRPFIRTYIIGKKTNVIYSKKSYNQNGELIYLFEYSAIDFSLREEDCRSLFKTPSDIYGMAESEELGFE